MDIRIAGTVAESIVDGPGFRFTIFVQGCPHKCAGCHNPQTHDFNGGILADTEEIFKKIIKDPLLDGVTFSGGEPFCQCVPLADLAEKIKTHSNLNIICYTGYTMEYILQHMEEISGSRELIKHIDYLVDGKFIQELRSLELKFMGSSNQRFIDVQQSLKLGKIVTAEPY